MIQTWFLLTFVAWLTGLRVGSVTHHIVNAHIYEDQWEGVEEQISRIGDGMLADSRNSARGNDFEYMSALGGSYLDGSHTKLDLMLAEVDAFTLDEAIFPAMEHLGPIEFPFSV